MLATLVFSSIVVFIFVYCFRILKFYQRQFTLLLKLPGPPKHDLILGNTAKLLGPPEQTFQCLREWNKKYYPVYKLYSMHKIGANILMPEDCELILSNPVHNDKGYFYKLLHKWLKFGLLTSTGEKWQTRRKILTPAFHFNILQKFVKVFNEEADQLVQVLQKESDNSYVDVVPLIAQFTLKTIAETSMGTKLHFSGIKYSKYKEAVYEMGKVIFYRVTHPWCLTDIGNLLSPHFLKELKLVKTLHKFTAEVIKEREKTFTEIDLSQNCDVYKLKKQLVMLDLLLSAKREGIIDDEGIQEEVDTFMFEGHDTTAVSLGFTLMLLANRKEIQENLVQEMREILGDLNKKPAYNDLQNLKYMERCIKESLRLYPSVHFISRNLGEDVKLHSGYLLPKGSLVAIHIYDVHRNPEIYPDPETFDPDRFLPERSQERHPYAFLPFSAGPRNCIGQKFAMLELKAALCAILVHFVLEPIDTQDTVVLISDIVLRAKDGIKIKFVQRAPSVH